LSQLLEPSNSNVSTADSGVRPRDAYGQSLPAADQPAGSADAAATPWHMMTRPLKVETANGANKSAGTPARESAPTPPSPSQSRSQSLPLFEGDFDIGLSSFCRGAGIDPRSITSEARSSALQLAGQLFREAVLGLMDLNQSRNEFRNKFRMPPPSAEESESPLNLSRGVDEALVRLLTTVSTRARSVEALRENFRELKAQNGATLAATRAAFEEFLSRVDPKELEGRFDRVGRRGVFGGQSKAKYWDLYAELFSGLAQRPADGFPHLFIETFAKAYEAKLRALVPPRRTIGGEREEPGNPNNHAVGDHD
jgi:type VI secretion system FHA domain protein